MSGRAATQGLKGLASVTEALGNGLVRLSARCLAAKKSQ